MVYLLQAEEREIPYDLLQGLAAVLAESSDIAFADATRRIYTGHGILEFETREEADRVSARVASLGLRTFVVDHLLDLPEPDLLDVTAAKLSEEIDLAAAARVDSTTEHTVTTYNWLNARGIGLGNTFVPDPTSVIQENRVEETDTEFYLDVFAGPHHWRIKEQSAGPFLELVKGLALSAAALGLGVKNLLAGNRNLPRFPGEREYGRYLTWLYQLRYAAR